MTPTDKERKTVKSNRGGNLAALRERAVATRASLVVTARELFAEAGYHAIGTTEIAVRASMTRGALYHHFADKEALFEEVFRTVAQELVDRGTAAAVNSIADTWTKVTTAFGHYLDLVAANEEYQRILLIDGPVVLGWQRWRQLQGELIGKGTADALLLLMDQGIVARQPAEPLACLIQAALNDSAMTIAHAPKSVETSEQAKNAFIFLLEGIRHRPDHPAS